MLTDPGELGLEVGEVLAVGDAEVVVGVVVLASWATHVDGFAVPMPSTAAGPSARCARLISPMVAGALPMVVDDTDRDQSS